MVRFMKLLPALTRFDSQREKQVLRVFPCARRIEALQLLKQLFWY
jgi:hypothetical protein